MPLKSEAKGPRRPLSKAGQATSRSLYLKAIERDRGQSTCTPLYLEAMEAIEGDKSQPTIKPFLKAPWRPLSETEVNQQINCSIWKPLSRSIYV